MWSLPLLPTPRATTSRACGVCAVALLTIVFFAHAAGLGRVVKFRYSLLNRTTRATTLRDGTGTRTP